MEPTRTLMERKRREAADELVRTAIAMFARDGFDATTVEAIATEAGCSPRTFYRYFGSKEDILFADVPSVIERLVAALDEHLAAGASAWAAASEAVVTIIERLDGRDEELAMARMRLWLDEPALHDRYVRHVTSAEEALAAAIARHGGRTPAKDDLAQVVAIAAIGAYRTTVTTHGDTRTPKQLARHLRQLLALFGEGLDH